MREDNQQLLILHFSSFVSCPLSFALVKRGESLMIVKERKKVQLEEKERKTGERSRKGESERESIHSV